jgi:hypothetical protein
MQFISCHDGKLQTLAAPGLQAGSDRAFVTGLSALDQVAPARSFARGAVHELLFFPRDGEPRFIAAFLARAASLLRPVHAGAGQAARPSPARETRGAIIWSDPRGEIYPPALAALGIDLSHVYLLRPGTIEDENWAIAEALRCKGVGAVIAAPRKLSRIEARRLQLAAERGGATGILLRPSIGRGSTIYAAATRWLVAPAAGEPMIQRWTIQLLHGHGGRIGTTVLLESCRESHCVRAVERLVDRPSAKKAAEERRAIA